MIEFSINNENYENEMMELVRFFEPRVEEDFSLTVNYSNDGHEMSINLVSDFFLGFQKNFNFLFEARDEMEKKRVEKRYLKIAIYRTLSFLTGINLPYGCLTGIRPTKMFFELEVDTNITRTAREIFSKDYSVSDIKLNLIEEIVHIQKTLKNQSENSFDIFIFIPFCPSKCAYCSFVSLPIDRQRKLLEPYIECLIKELDNTKELVRARNFDIRAVYIGGGTPTSLPLELLDKVLSHCQFSAKEFTVEAGRPDTIDTKVLKILKKHGVTRISINPQTFNDRTLELIGRKHKSSEVVDAYKLAKNKFDINMDLIAMLPEETLDDFKHSVDTAIKLSPENITVHTLYMKKGSELKLANYKNTDFYTASAMVDYAYRALTESGYRPYYMYRQKYTSGNLENVGYAKVGKECIYNIDIMEEDTSIIANGAAAISKKWTKEINLIERNANFKEPLEYIKHFDTVISRQKVFWDM